MACWHCGAHSPAALRRRGRWQGKAVLLIARLELDDGVLLPLLNTARRGVGEAPALLRPGGRGSCSLRAGVVVVRILLDWCGMLLVSLAMLAAASAVSRRRRSERDWIRQQSLTRSDLLLANVLARSKSEMAGASSDLWLDCFCGQQQLTAPLERIRARSSNYCTREMCARLLACFKRSTGASDTRSSIHTNIHALLLAAAVLLLGFVPPSWW